MDENKIQELRLLAAAAIRMVRHQVRWKPGKDVQHLEKRIVEIILHPELRLINITSLFKKYYQNLKVMFIIIHLDKRTTSLLPMK